MAGRAEADGAPGGPGPGLVLASVSPRRRQLLEAAGIPFEAVDPGPEPPAPPGPPRDAVLALARAKAEAGARLRPGRPVLAADTLVACGGRLLAKPRDRAAAEAMLRDLAGREHEVWTAVCLRLPDGRFLESVDRAVVRFRQPPEGELAAWLASGRWRDKAGAYAIQEAPGAWAEVVAGDRETVVGLATATVRRLLAAAAPCLEPPTG